jgi:hypothetical protein
MKMNKKIDKHSDDFKAGVKFATEFIKNRLTAMGEAEKNTVRFNKAIENKEGQLIHHYAARLVSRIKTIINKNLCDE